eukprot:TRINITY_DN3199_c0_g2_i2.p1 TRINITY_DN3199_c0_g2~~TRINITY_DN3199_c0_g2_i2.p1  ORF type:complete len:133 (+),score=31.99 TRINITY_DN3199_c0_g2_i2:178-576(+)
MSGRKRRRKRISPPPPPTHEEEYQHDSDSDQIAVVDEMDFQEIPTKRLPLLRDYLRNENMLEFTKCHTCGEILCEQDERDDAMGNWWRCCKCLSEFCPNSSEVCVCACVCHEYDDPDADILRAVKNRIGREG